MQIERHTIRKRSNGELLTDKKLVLTKIDDHHFLAQGYARHSYSEGYMNDASTSNYDGQNTINGKLCTTTTDTVDERFELLMKYEGYTLVE